MCVEVWELMISKESGLCEMSTSTARSSTEMASENNSL
jgi:hypothetical protein